jgi:CheY-like chemotaxis protein
MPGMNGFAFLEEAAKHAEWQHIPIVILTAMPLDAAERALLAGRAREVIARAPTTSPRRCDRSWCGCPS